MHYCVLALGVSNWTRSVRLRSDQRPTCQLNRQDGVGEKVTLLPAAVVTMTPYMCARTAFSNYTHTEITRIHFKCCCLFHNLLHRRDTPYLLRATHNQSSITFAQAFLLVSVLVCVCVSVRTADMLLLQRHTHLQYLQTPHTHSHRFTYDAT